MRSINPRIILQKVAKNDGNQGQLENSRNKLLSMSLESEKQRIIFCRVIKIGGVVEECIGKTKR